MTTPPLDLPALRDIANAATEGPWRVIEGDGWDGPGVAMDESGMQIGIAYICENFGQGESEGEDDAAFVAAFDPPTVLALLDRAEAAEAKVAAVRELHTKEKHGVQHHCGECLQDDNTGSWEYVEWPCPTITALDATP